jgi:protein-tyrosine phosphatase
LHGIDDGAETFDEAMEMLEVAFSNGTTDLVLTPHYLSNDLRSTGVSKADILKRFEDLRSAAESKFDGLKLYIGAETFAAANILECAETDALLPINNTRYLLLEFGFDDTVSRALTVTRELHRLGYTAIVAHPERYGFFLNDPGKILSFLDEGALLQINANSVLGQNGVRSREMSLSLIDNGLAAFVSSDAHSVRYRSPDLSEAYSFVASAYDSDFAEALFERNPMTILQDKIIL